MLLEFVLLQWISALIFSYFAFKWRANLMFPLVAAIFWITTAYSMVQVDFVGFGSMNVIVYDHEMGDWYGDNELFYWLGSLGVLYLIYAFWNMLVMSKHDIDKVSSGSREEIYMESSKDWKDGG